MTTLLSTQLENETKLSYLQDQIEKEKCDKILIKENIKSIEEQIITNELKASQQLEEQEHETSSRLRDMQDKNNVELNRINLSIENLEENQTKLWNNQDKFYKLVMSVSENKTEIDDLKSQVESTCNKRIELERKVGIMEQVQELQNTGIFFSLIYVKNTSRICNI